MEDRAVVMTGMGAVSCLGWGVGPLWQGLLAGRCGIAPLTRINPEPYRIRHAGQVPPSSAASSSDTPAMQFLLAAGAEALNQAGVGAEAQDGIALVLGSNFGAMAQTECLLTASHAGGPLALADGVSAEVAERLGLSGMRSTVSLSCASGNAALGCAADMIRTGHADAVLAGGYDAISEVVWAGLCSLRAMSATALRPFDRRRDGTIFSEGAGLLLLESEARARERGARPLARFLGYATSSNAFHMTHPDADGAGMARAMRGALRDAGIGPDSVDHINAHATGTPPNDSLETAAIKSVFGGRAHQIPINGIKSMLGHAMGAASALEAIATVQTLRHGVIPPTLGLEEPDPACDLDYVPREARCASVRVALNNSAGFGGCNASTIFARWEERA